MHFFYLASVLFALPFSNLQAGVDGRALALQKRGPPTPEQLAELRAAKDAKKAAQAAAENDPNAAAAKAAKKKADLENEQATKALKAAEKAEKTRQAAEAKAIADFNAAQKQAKAAPAKVQSAQIVDKAHVIGEPKPVDLQFSEAFLDKHINNGVGSGVGKKKTVIMEPIKGFEPGVTTPNPKGTGQRLTLTTQHSVDLRHFEKSSSGRFVPTGSDRGRVTVSGQQQGSVFVIDHLERVIPSKPGIKPPTMVSPRMPGLPSASSVIRGIRV